MTATLDPDVGEELMRLLIAEPTATLDELARQIGAPLPPDGDGDDPRPPYHATLRGARNDAPCAPGGRS